MAYSTIGFVKTVNLTNLTFTLEPIQNYKFIADEKKAEEWKMIFCPEDQDVSKLYVMDQRTPIAFPGELTNEMIAVKQGRIKDKVSIVTSNVIISENSSSLLKMDCIAIELV